MNLFYPFFCDLFYLLLRLSQMNHIFLRENRPQENRKLRAISIVLDSENHIHKF